MSSTNKGLSCVRVTKQEVVLDIEPLAAIYRLAPWPESEHASCEREGERAYGGRGDRGLARARLHAWHGMGMRSVPML